jgi:CheY-like chemotaxis protein
MSSASAPGRRLLVVDDNEDVARAFALLLTALGHYAEFVTHAREAIDAARRIDPEIAFIDIGMPEMDGLELAARMRSDPRLKGVCLVAVTGYDEPGDRVRSRQAGFDAHIRKPVDPELVASILAQFPRRGP